MSSIAVGFVLGVAGLLVWSLLTSRIGELHRRIDALTSASERRSREIENLRLRLRALEGVQAPAPVERPAIAPAAPDLAPASRPSPPTATPAPARATRPASRTRRSIDTAALLARLPVWLGSAALALAGAFLVKYGWERDWLGPLARVSLAFGFGVACLGAGEFLRRRAAGVARGLVASGIAVLYAATLAGVHLYDLIPEPVGFLLLAAITAGAVLLSLAHGAWVAVLGLVGGYMTPTWIGAREPSAAALFTYLLLLHVGLVAVGRARRWTYLPLASGVTAALWAAAWIVGGGRATFDSAVLGVFIWLLAASAIVVTQSDASLRGSLLGRMVGHAGPVAGMVLLAALVGTRSFSTVEWVMFGAIAAGCVLLARWRDGFGALAWVALAASLGLLGLWSLAVDPAQAGRFATTCAAFGFGFVLSGAAFARSGPAPRASAARSAIATSAFLLVAKFGLYARADIPWWAIGLAGAAVQAALAWDAFARRERLPDGVRVGSVHAVGAVAAAAVAAGMDAPAWTIAPCLALLSLAVLRVRRTFDAIETRIAGPILGGLAVLTALLAPTSSAWPYGAVRLMLGHGGTVALLAGAAAIVRGRDERHDEGVAAAFAALAGGSWLALAIREAFRPDPYPRTIEWGVLLAAGTAYGLALRRIAVSRAVPGLAVIADALASAALAVGTLVVSVPANPVLSRFDVGTTPVANAIAVAYGLPCAAAACAAIVWRRAGGRHLLASFAGAVATWLGFLIVTLEVRQAFRGTNLRAGSASDGELYAYSVAWILFSLALLVLARRVRGRLVGIASASVMGIAVVKVFLFDTGNLTGLYRVGSLLGLGLTLLGLAWVYQRWVFVRPSGPDDGVTAGP